MSTKSKAEKQAALKAAPVEHKKTEPIPTPAQQKEQAAAKAKEEAAAKKAEKQAAKEARAKSPGIIQQILTHFKNGLTLKQISEQVVTGTGTDKDGTTFSPITISIQVAKYKKKHPDIYPPVVRPTKEERQAAKAQKAADRKAEREAKAAEKEARAKKIEAEAAVAAE